MISKYDLYLYLSYLPDIEESGIRWLEYDEDPEPGPEADQESWWVERGGQAFDETMRQQLQDTPRNATHIVPLSAGLDSRAILAWLSENLPKSKIITITYGIPGAWDYEIAPLIAQKVGVQHVPMNLLDECWDLDGLISTGASLYHPANVYEAYVHREMCYRFGADCVYWSGFLAGSLAGVHLQTVPSTTKEQAARFFLEHNRTPHFKDQAFHEEMVRMILDEYPWEDNLYQTKMGLDQQLDYGIRHRHYIRSVLLFQDYKFKAPFISKPWLSFILNVPYKWLLHKHMYIQVLLKCYPELYQLPVRMNAAQPLDASPARVLIGKALAKIQPRIFPKDPYRSHPRTNYMNFSEALRDKTRFQAVVYGTLQDLKKRKIVDRVNIDTLWSDHLNRRADNNILLQNLSSLEILLKSGSI